MSMKSHLKCVSILIFAALTALPAWGQELTKSGTVVFPAERVPAVFPAAAKGVRPAANAGVYTIVTTPDLRGALLPFAAWKRQQGFDVELLCVESPHRDSLRAALSRRNSPGAAPRYVLLAGDVDRIPSFWGKYRPSGLGNHVTDLYYGEYDGDYLPEAFVGRLSATDSAEMAAVADKLIAYEQGRWADVRSQLLLVAGDEDRDPAPVTTNGQVHYLAGLAAQFRPDADTVCFYNPASGGSTDSIVAALEQGNLLVNYTAHCLSGGWSSPAIDARTFDTLDNPVPTVFVNNCCLSNAFNGTCFGETLLRRPQGGAVAVIGATNETLWNEDYYWAVGAKRPPSHFPLYDSLAPGAFDTLVAHAECEYTLGGMLYAGCKAVSQSGSPFDAFYWETYTLLGDPSMTLFWTHADSLSLTATDSIRAGSTHLSLHCNLPCRVSATQDTVLLATALTMADGSVTLSLPAALDGDSITLTATRREAVCNIVTLPIARPAEPFLAAVGHHLEDTVLTVRVRNVGRQAAHGHQIQLTQDSTDREHGAELHRSPACTIGLLEAQADTVVALPLERMTLGAEPFVEAQLTMSDSLGQPYSTLPLHLELPDRYPRLAHLLVLDGDSLPVSELLPDHEYIIQASLAHPADSLTITAGGQRLDISPLSPLTYTSRLLTPADLQYLPVTVTAYLDNWHNTYAYWLTAHHATEPFETGDFSNLPWYPAAANPWQIDSMAPYSGRYCARSAVMEHSQKSVLALDIEVIHGDSLSFCYRVSSEASDWLNFYIDGRRTGYWSGNSGWHRFSTLLAAGHHRLQWVYQKDASHSELDDCARIDDIRLPLALWAHPSGTPQADSLLSVRQPDSRTGPSISVCPNPSRGRVAITFPPSAESRTLLVYDTYGRLCDKKNIPPSTSSTQYSTTHLRLGAYTLVLHGSTGVSTQKMTVIQ